ncbi:MAG: aminotransferase class I/II-fold pyridoxal phosphate-dependent enzyme [Amphritea sp.]|nr:aminotransferase class I/II-fold pyridoxal phosphate-dependent enzyme [Amphritea sp.]MBQ0784677.1 aminotransferase class I/II-fold pyridoxal phosphate-dependent enzyme [Amphritea sp.]
MSNKRRSVVRRSNEPENIGSPLTTPLYSSVVYHYSDVDQLKAVYEKKAKGFTYARYGNPNSAVMADKISWMENAQGGVMTASGMSAISAVFLGLLEAGDSIAAATQLYGQSLKMTSQVLPRLGFETTFFDASDPSTFADAIHPSTKIILAEIVSNPMLRVTDFPALTKAAKDVGALLVIDNTFTTPTGFNPLDHGADMVIHSVTKMLSGHSDLNLGYIGANDPELLNKLDETVSTLGLNASPHNCWLAEKGLHTFDLRLKQAQENASKLSRLLSEHPKVSRVHYPGLSTHPDHAIAKELLNGGFGTMVSFVLKGGYENLNTFLRAAENIPYGPSLGDVATMLIVPAVSSHRELDSSERLKLGIEDNLIRVSVGIESFDIIRDDFLEALEVA